MRDVRRRDAERLEMQLTGGIYAGTGLLKGNAPTPAPLSQPRKPGQVMNPGATPSQPPVGG
jgi:glutathione-regulated potassium-efflux system protein KefB